MEGTAGGRVVVAVSKEMQRLRKTQNRLNGFWANTELCYAFVLSQRHVAFADTSRKSVEVLGHLESEVWYPSRQGRIKRDESVGDFLAHVERNTVHIYQATMLAFYSAFEAFLRSRVGAERRTGKRWAPFVVSLAGLHAAPTPLSLRTVMCADLSRRARNMVAHGGIALPDSLEAKVVEEWRAELEKTAIEAGWSQAKAAKAAKASVRRVVGQAIAQREEARQTGKALPIELFYMLFSFTNLDNLACEIEEALIAEGETPAGRIGRAATAVRRRELVQEATPAPARLAGAAARPSTDT